MKQRYLGWTDERNDVKYIEGFIGDKASELKHLKAGEFIYSHPTKNILEKIQINPHEQTTKPQRILPRPIYEPKPTIVTKPQASQQSIGQVLYFSFLLPFIVYLFLRA